MSASRTSLTIQTADPLELEKSKLLIGEGKDEVLIFDALLNHLRINDIQVEDYGGKDKLPDYLDALVLRPGFDTITSLGVTRDADTDPSRAFRSLRNYLSHRKLVTPASSGTIEAGTPNIGIMILPDGLHPGMLEDLFLAALQTDSLIQCIDKYFECVGATEGNLPNQISKARVHAWLAALDPPDMRLGIAAQRGFIDWNSPSFDQLKNFLTAL